MADFSHTTRDLSLESSAEEKFRLVVESCPGGMVMTDSGNKIVLVNTETERLFGYTRDELIGRTMEMLANGSAIIAWSPRPYFISEAGTEVNNIRL